jgi:peptidoglycan/xylan/chitin deacetylase (PgdA/CDA1 family)
VVRYHFVRPIAAGAYPRLKGLEPERFAQQLDYIASRYAPVAPSAVVDAALTGCALPDRAALLTFDDGYTDHVRYVAPELRARQMVGLFFPVAQSLLDRRVLDVNKIQFVLASADVANIVAEIDECIDDARDRFDLDTAAGYRAVWWKPSQFDPPDIVFVKRMLQAGLPLELRTEIVNRLFAQYVTHDEMSFARELYFSVDDARALLDQGMAIGAHGDRHLRLPTLSREGQEREIDGALRILDALGVPRRRYCYCYANGERNAHSEEILTARACAIAFTTRPEVAVITAANRLALPRLDTNDVSVDADERMRAWSPKP